MTKAFAYGSWASGPIRDSIGNHRRHIRCDDDFPSAVSHGVATKQGMELVKTTGSFAGYLLGVCPPGETTIQVKPEVLKIVRPGQGIIAYIQSVGGLLCLEKTTAVLLAMSIATLHLSAH